MNRPGTRHFIGPLTPAQQRRRKRARAQFREAAEISDVRCVSMREAFHIASGNIWYSGKPVQMARP